MWDLCQQKANINVYAGDSGGLIYAAPGQGGVTPRPGGTLIQSDGTSCWFSPIQQVLGSLGNRYYLAW
jgi:hypothetical protein